MAKKQKQWLCMYTELRDHPKVDSLSRMMGWSYAETLGHIAMLWMWCVDYAIDGDLRVFDDVQIAKAAGVAAADAKKFKDAMIACGKRVESGVVVESGFIDRKPYFRIHDWWEIVKIYVTRYKFSDQPEVCDRIEAAYGNGINTEALDDKSELGKNLPNTCQDSAKNLPLHNITKNNNYNLPLTPSSKAGEYASPDLSEVIRYLNKTAGREYDVFKKGFVAFVNEIYKQGATVAMMKMVVDWKVYDWQDRHKDSSGNINIPSGEKDMSNCLNPCTLFHRVKFWVYFEEAVRKLKEKELQQKKRSECLKNKNNGPSAAEIEKNWIEFEEMMVYLKGKYGNKWTQHCNEYMQMRKSEISKG